MSTQSLMPGWKMLKFGDIAQNVAVRVDPADAKTDVYVGLEHLDPSTLHLRQWGQPSDVTGQKLAFKKGDVIFGRRRAYQRKLAIAEFDGICSAHAMVVRAKPKMILPEFLPFFLQSDMFMERAIEISVGSLSPTINWKTLREQVFPLPPLDEQKQIAEILWVASLEQEAKNNVLEANRVLLLRKLSEISRFLNPKDRTYPWEESKLGTIFKHKKDKGYSDLPTLSVTIDGKIVPRDSLNRNVEDRTGPEKCFRVDPGDIAYNTMRMWQGACALSTDSGVISPAYTVISIKSKDQLPEFWIRVFRTPWMKKTFERFSTGVASDRWRLYYRDFSAIKIKRPPLTFQQNVMDELFALELAVKSAEVSVQNSLGLQKALIQKYLTGATYV